MVISDTLASNESQSFKNFHFHEVSTLLKYSQTLKMHVNMKNNKKNVNSHIQSILGLVLLFCVLGAGAEPRTVHMLHPSTLVL